jgi:hypothetical protein
MAKKHGLMGELNLLGLGTFGGGLSPLWGTLIGGGVAGITSMTLGHVKHGSMAKDREFYGLLAGLGASGVLFGMKSTRQSGAAFASLVGAFLASGLPWLEKKLLGTVQLPTAVAAQIPAAAGAVAGMGIARINELNGGLRGRQVSYLNGLGIPSIAPQPESVGTIPGVAGPSFAGTQMGTRSPVSLLGAPSARSNQISLMGGPQIHGLSAAYGATLLGAGR